MGMNSKMNIEFILFSSKTNISFLNFNMGSSHLEANLQMLLMSSQMIKQVFELYNWFKLYNLDYSRKLLIKERKHIWWFYFHNVINLQFYQFGECFHIILLPQMNILVFFFSIYLLKNCTRKSENGIA